LVDARQRVVESALAHGKFAGTVASPANYEELQEMGYRFLSMGADVVGLSQYCQSIMSEFNKQSVEAPKGLYSGKKP
jgi:4-hydroxy-2-oxoheptanedioate aldolase